MSACTRVVRMRDSRYEPECLTHGWRGALYGDLASAMRALDEHERIRRTSRASAGERREPWWDR